jgi:hypothetical protein
MNYFQYDTSYSTASPTREAYPEQDDRIQKKYIRKLQQNSPDIPSYQHPPSFTIPSSSSVLSSSVLSSPSSFPSYVSPPPLSSYPTTTEYFPLSKTYLTKETKDPEPSYNPCVITCLDISNHITSCPVCKKIYNQNAQIIFIVVVFLLVIIILYLLKQVLKI